MRKIKSIFALILCLILAFNVFGCGDTANENGDETGYVGKPVELTLWYTDSRLTTYLEYVAEKYHESNNSITVNNVLVSKEKYLQNVYNGCVKEGNGPDLFISSSDDLEEICYMGLAWDNEDTITYSVENYGNAAVNAASYNGKLYGYPLTYETAVMVYNSDYAVSVSSFGDLEQYVKNYAPDENSPAIEFIVQWDVTDVFLNYAFVGNYISIGGTDGDSGDIDYSSDDFERSLQRYIDIKDDLGIDKDDATYEKCMQQFCDTKLLYTIINSKDLKKLDESDINYSVVKIPDYDSVYASKAMSQTSLAIVSPYGNNKKQAINYAKALTYDYAGQIIARGAGCPARGNVEDLPKQYASAHNVYKDTIVKSQLMKTGDTYMKLEVVLHKIWDGGDVHEAFNEFNQYMTIQWGIGQ
ncbi:MAG: extracellular solute-binding protein [Lachnospiraceae bacterium]